MLLKALAILARLGALTSSLIVAGLTAKFLTRSYWLTSFLIYIEVVAAVSIFAALAPPYPSFLYDSFWAAAWIVGAVFAIVVQFGESNCYGLRPEGEISCGAYKAGTAFAFLALLAWLGCAGLGALRILAVLANVDDRYWGRPLHLGATKEDEAVPREKLRKVAGFGNTHIARWFICYGLLGVILLAVGIPLLVIYAAPSFALYLISNLPIPANIAIALSNPSNNSIGVAITSDVEVPATSDVTFSPMNVSFFYADNESNLNYADTPIASLSLPELKYGSEEHFAIPEQRLQLGDVDAFAEFLEAVAFKGSFAISGRARVKIGIGRIKTWVDLDKSIEFSGFNSFPTLNITEMNLDRDEEGYNLHAKVTLENPTPASATLGNVTLALTIGATTIGSLQVPMTNITPGVNTLSVSAILNMTNIQENMAAILSAEIPYLKNEEIIASASLSSVVYEAQHLEYWEQAFGRLELSLVRPVRPLVKVLLDGGFLGAAGGLVEDVLDTILENVKGLSENEVGDYIERLSELGSRVLGLLGVLDIM
ncbi:hypothetical protein BDW74DRAFT_178020 [Aspergillus multicolor]|uniref:uncharacterized protein n=1 Tax=Aspergillus multicolor TaxID=41759 RepID=UPI003CCE0660